MSDFATNETAAAGLDILSTRLADIYEKTSALLADPERLKTNHMNGSAYVLSEKELLCLGRDNGDSRYPYGCDGFNLWVYASGYIHANEGLLSTFLRAANGKEPNAAFFVGKKIQENDYQLTSLFSVPKMLNKSNDLVRYAVFSPSAAYFVAEFDSLRFGVRIYATPDRAISISIHAENVGTHAASFFLSSFLNPFLRHQLHTSDEDNWFKEISLLQPEQKEPGALDPFLMMVHEDKDRHTLTTNYGVLRRELSVADKSWLVSTEATTSRLQYVGGAHSSLHTPKGLLQGTFGDERHLCTFTETAIMGDLLHLNLPAGENVRLDLMFSPVKTHDEAIALANTRMNPAVIDSELANLEQEDNANHAALKVRTCDSAVEKVHGVTFNAFVEHLKKQVEFCSLIKGYIQLSFNSLIGIRDVFQALEGMLFWRGDAARDKMLEALSFTAVDGRCFRQYSLPPANQDVGRMDLRQFIDQGVWVISTIHTYLRVTQDWEFLNTICGYHEIVDEAAGKVIKSDQKDSVLEHMIRIMGYLLRNRDHDKTKCSLALYGDWNDALDGLGISLDGSSEFGTGVSVMATLQVYQNTEEMVDILNRVDGSKYAEIIDQYDKAREEIRTGLLKYAIVSNDSGEQRILHGWGDQYSYFVGSYKDSDGMARDGLTSNAFWILSGLYKEHPEFKKAILDGLERLDSKYGYRTFAPHFDIDAKGVGRIPKLPPGTAENGASYVHATAFGIMALFQIGEAQKAWEQLYKILPFTDGHENLTHSPFIMPNSYGYNPEKFIDGQNMNDWQTGSSNVVLKLLIRYVLGFEPEMDGLWIQPANWCPFGSFRFELNIRDSLVCIDYQNKQSGKRSFQVNGQPQESKPDELMGIEKLWIPNEQLDATDTIKIQIVD